MNKNISPQKPVSPYTIITAGSNYLDIDAYACCVAMRELLELKGEKAVAYSNATCNYSVCKSLIHQGQIMRTLPSDCNAETAKYIIVDVSDPNFIKDAVPIESVTEVYDHHVGFEGYWESRIGDNSHIEFIGAAATLIYREWKNSGLQDKMTRPTALLLIAAILDNTLNLISSNTTSVDIEAFDELCKMADVVEDWCASYFSEVQASIQADMKNALFNDIKRIRDNEILPEGFAQLCIWNASEILENLTEIRNQLNNRYNDWMINIIDIKHRCSYFVCDDAEYQNKIRKVFEVSFESGVAKTAIPYLRKEIIKKTLCSS